jgi:hypothetical protein
MTYKNLFIAGLLFETMGQILLAKGNEFVYAQKPIDFAHWFLLIGVVLLLPQIVSFPKKIHSYSGIPTAIIGVVCIIGMCVLDFIFWSFPTQELRNEFAGHLSKVSVIWKPFITIGPNFLNVGLLLLSLNYFKKNKLGVALVILATLILFFARFIPFRIILVYLMTAIGFAIIFYKKSAINEH